MSELTSETLRAIVRRSINGLITLAEIKLIDKHADAWESNEKRLETVEKLLRRGRDLLSNESIIKVQGDLVGQVVFGSWTEDVDAVLAGKEIHDD